MIRHQNILTYPTLNFAQSENLMVKMGINAGGAVEIWHPRTKTWCVEDVDHTMNIKGQPEVFVRFLGVANCLGFEELIGEVSGELSSSVVDNGKRQLNADGEEMTLVLEARHAMASTWLPSTPLSISPSTPSLVSCSPSVTYFHSQAASSQFLSPPQSPAFPSLDAMQHSDTNSSPWTQPNSFSGPPHPTDSVPNYDYLWQRGFVHVPNTSLWPSGMYARDMAWGLTKLNESRKSIKQRFHEVFPGVLYVKTTYYRQRDAFFNSSIREIEQCRALTRGPNGMWMNWRGTSSGWKLAAERKKVSNIK